MSAFRDKQFRVVTNGEHYKVQQRTRGWLGFWAAWKDAPLSGAIVVAGHAGDYGCKEFAVNWLRDLVAEHEESRRIHQIEARPWRETTLDPLTDELMATFK